MGRPKIVTFTGLEDLESQDSRPAKKKKGKKTETASDATETESEKKAAAQVSTAPLETTQELVEELVEKADAPGKIELETESKPKVENESQSQTPTQTKPKVGKAKERSKRYQSLLATIEKGKIYSLPEALEALKATAKTSFDPTIEIHINVGADITKSDQQVRTTTKLPHSVGKSPRLLIFATDGKAFEEKGAVTIGDEKTLDQIEKTGKVDADKVIATPEWMPKLTKLAKILGPKGMMPNPKTGTVTNDIAKTVADFKGGLLEIRTETGGPIIHSRVGKLSLGDEKLTENLKALMDAVTKAKPTSIKRNYLKSAYLHVTMGPSVRLDLSSL